MSSISEAVLLNELEGLGYVRLADGIAGPVGSAPGVQDAPVQTVSNRRKPYRRGGPRDAPELIPA